MPKKKYSINWEDDEAVSFEVNGVVYESLDDVPDDDDRDRLQAMLDSAEDAEFDKEFEELDKQHQAAEESGVDIEKIILSVFTGIAVLMLLIAGISTYSSVNRISREESVPGVVLEVVKQRQYINEQDRVTEDYYYPVVEYVSKDGKRHSLQLNEGSSSPNHEVGDEVMIRYNPDHPLEARIDSFWSTAGMFILPTITGILGIGFLGAVIAVRVVLHKDGEAE
jgi:hypothetical protein